MKGRDRFSVEEADRIRGRLRALRKAEPGSEQKLIRDQLRAFDFFISDWPRSSAGFTVSDFDELVRSARIGITQRDAAAVPPAPRCFMQSWAQKYWRDTAQARGDEGAAFTYTASDRFDQRGLRSGDRLYLVGIDGGELLLIGRMDVERVVTTAQAKRLLGSASLYPKKWHATGRPPFHPLTFERRVPERVARAIRTDEGKPIAIDSTSYRIPNMALRTPRFLAPESAASLDALIDDELADSDEVRDAEVSVRGRAFGTRLTAAQRRAIENCAVIAATKHFEDEGWDVQDVGLCGPYDLHCIKGRRVLHVEAKGTRGSLASIPLTAGEVADAREHHPDTALYVMHGIKLDGSPTQPRTREGEVYLERPWQPKSSRLRALVYSYRLA